MVNGLVGGDQIGEVDRGIVAGSAIAAEVSGDVIGRAGGDDEGGRGV